MPELPEVEVTRRGIAPQLVGQRIDTAVVRNKNLRWPIPAHLPKTVAGLTIRDVNRRGKYLLIDCGLGFLLLHLGMSGSLRLLAADVAAQKHDHFDLILANHTRLRLKDPRRFGAVLWLPGDLQNALQHPLLAHLGPEPLTAAFTGKALHDAIRGRKVHIKIALMNSRIVVGVGNIYASEALFGAGIHPDTAAGKIGLVRCEKLAQTIKTILQAAIQAGGSSLRDFVGSDGNPGYFQQNYFVYGRGGEPCRKCGASIKQITQGQRSSFYCPRCQR